jgi:fibronectin type III domain protein/parallel beta helix pectate lyase-like protein/IPT/TIG domain-containing protein
LTAIVILGTGGPAGAAATLQVPANYPTIQAAINAAANGDTVRVAPGTYVENIDFLGKEITVESESGPDVTIIDGNQTGNVVKINVASGLKPVLRGFTIRNGKPVSNGHGGGVQTQGGQPLIEGNAVVSNRACSAPGIEARFSGATIRGNTISNNFQSGCSGGGGGGVSIGGSGSVQVIGNLISGNSHGSSGGGIDLFAAGTPTISGNIISGNTAGTGSGGGIDLVNTSNALIVNNVIAGNSAAKGGAIYWGVPINEPGPTVMNNTIVNNTAASGSALFAAGFDAASQFVNNIVTGSGTLLYCEGMYDGAPPVIAFNDVFNVSSGTKYGGICTDQTGLNGNISADPRFANPLADLHVLACSPAIDAGTNTGAPTIDIDGDQRPLDGNGDGAATVDIGAYEIGASVPDPPTAVSAIAHDSSATVSWTGPVCSSSPITGYSVASSPGGVVVETGADASSAVVTGLENGTAYTFTAVARSAIGESAPSTQSAPVTPRPGPTVTGFDPTSGTPGKAVLITGNRLYEATSVTIGGVAAEVVWNTPTHIEVLVPDLAVAGVIEVSTQFGVSASPTAFTVKRAPRPKITGFSPTSGGPGTTVTISGSALLGASSVTFGGVNATIKSNTSSAVKVLVPVGAGSGKVAVTTSRGTAESTGTFTPTPAPAPTISGFSPASAVQGATVKIMGSGLLAPSSVTFNGVAATITSWTATVIKAIVPAGVTTGQLAVTTPGGSTTSTGTFTRKRSPLPSISGFAPTSGVPGTIVTISGSGLLGASSLEFNGVQATITSNTASSINGVVPAVATTGSISLTTPGGSATSTGAFIVQ